MIDGQRGSAVGRGLQLDPRLQLGAWRCDAHLDAVRRHDAALRRGLGLGGKQNYRVVERVNARQSALHRGVWRARVRLDEEILWALAGTRLHLVVKPL